MTDQYVPVYYDEMTDEQVSAALTEYRAAAGNQPVQVRHKHQFLAGKTPTFTKAESFEAIASAFRSSATGRPLTTPHPLAAAMLEKGPVGLGHMVASMSRVAGRPLNGYSPAELVAFAATVPQFPSALIDTARAVLAARPNTLLSDVRALSADVRVANYNSQAFAFADIQLGLPDAESGSRFLGVVPRFSAQHVQVFSTFGKLVLSVQSLANDDVNLLPSLVVAFAAAAARAEAKGLAALLEANVLPDGAALFAAGNSNVGIGAITQSGLGIASSLLRSQPTEIGERSGAQLAAILVHSDDEIAALALVDSLPPSRQPLVIASPYLSTSANWYAFASPATHPALGRVLMVGADPSGISFSGIGPASWLDAAGKTTDFPGAAVDATHTVGLTALAPIGVVRLSKT